MSFVLCFRLFAFASHVHTHNDDTGHGKARTMCAVCLSLPAGAPAPSLIEVETPHFKHCRTSETEPTVSPLPGEWLEIVNMEKIIFDCESFSAECGISLSNEIGGEFNISAGAFPGALALRAPFVNMEFEPQYDVAACRREALSI
jgi:hypothetical protein